MKVGLIDVDGHNFPNLCLMKLSAYHKSKGDEFDYVFMPELSEKMLNMDVNQANLKSSTSLTFPMNFK